MSTRNKIILIVIIIIVICIIIYFVSRNNKKNEPTQTETKISALESAIIELKNMVPSGENI